MENITEVTQDQLIDAALYAGGSLALYDNASLCPETATTRAKYLKGLLVNIPDDLHGKQLILRAVGRIMSTDDASYGYPAR